MTLPTQFGAPAALLEPTPEDLAALLAAQRAAFFADGPPSLDVRRNRIDRLILMVTENAEAFSEAMNADFGHRPGPFGRMSDIAGMLPDVQLTRSRLKAWMRPTKPMRFSALMGMASKVERVPLGVVGIIGPWNFPLGLVVEPAAAAFAGGNNVMIKISEVTGQTAALFVEKVAEYFDPTELVAVSGGPGVGTAFAGLPLDHLFFTGSPKVGALVAEQAAKNLVPVTLELGGKNPVVVNRNANVAKAAGRVMAGRLMNGGQVCLCPETVFVPRESVPEFIDVATEHARRISTADSGNVSIVNDANFNRLMSVLDDARSRGATIHETVPGTSADASARRIQPLIVTGFDDSMMISHEELFGPILMVQPYDSIDEVIDYLAPRPSPLAAYWFGPKDTNFDSFTRRSRYGGMTVNDVGLHAAMPILPFGGVGQSGSGGYHGRHGFETFTHARPVTTSRLPISLGALATPPIGRRATQSIDSALGRAARGAKRRLERQ